MSEHLDPKPMEDAAKPHWFERFQSIDRRIIYILIAVSLSLPLMWDVVLPPAPLATASAFYDTVESLNPEDRKLVLIASDWGPGTKAENQPQTAYAIEHLMRKRIPFGLISITPFAAPFLKDVPREVAAKLRAEIPDEKWEYGKDWVNFGYQPSPAIFVQKLAKAKDFHEVIPADINQTPMADIPCMTNIRTIEDISLLMEFTGLVGAFNLWVQYFQSENYKPLFVHGCTSITIPEAYIYFVSEQIVGLLEGMAGAATYETLLSEKYKNRVYGDAIKNNTSLSIAQILIIFFVVLGNLGYFFSLVKRKS